MTFKYLVIKDIIIGGMLVNVSHTYAIYIIYILYYYRVQTHTTPTP